MNKQEAIQIRMLNQQLLSPLYERPEDIVAWQGAMQAQDYNYFRWAIGGTAADATVSWAPRGIC